MLVSPDPYCKRRVWLRQTKWRHGHAHLSKVMLCCNTTPDCCKTLSPALSLTFSLLPPHSLFLNLCHRPVCHRPMISGGHLVIILMTCKSIVATLSVVMTFAADLRKPCVSADAGYVVSCKRHYYRKGHGCLFPRIWRKNYVTLRL